MPHPSVVNKTEFALETLLLADEEGVPQYVPLVQAVYRIGPDGTLVLLEVPPPIETGGRWAGDPALTSMLREPQVAFTKPGTDVVLQGHAYPSSPGGTDGVLGIRVGRLQKTARVLGDRRYEGRLGGVSRPEPFEKIPIVWERAFGGWDRLHPDREQHRCEPRNPVGVGFRFTSSQRELVLPNFEDPDRPFRGLGDRPPPAGFGFLGADWQPRAAFAGTFDAEWDRTRKPLLPRDFDRRFFNSGSAGLVSAAPLRGDEPVVVVGGAPEGRVAFDLPAADAPACVLELRGRRRMTLQTALDTVIVDMEARLLTLMWRTRVAVRNGPHDVVSVELHASADAAARAQPTVVAVPDDEEEPLDEDE